MNQHNDIPGLEVLGPDWVEAWTDSSCVGKLCSRCETTLAKIDQPVEWKWWDDCTEAEKLHNSYSAAFCILWSEDDGPRLRDVRDNAHDGCHFCTLILTGMLQERKRIRLADEVETAVLSIAGLQDDDTIYLVLEGSSDEFSAMYRDEPRRKKHLYAGINRWCQAGQRGFDLLPEWERARGDQPIELPRRMASDSSGAPIEQRRTGLTSDMFDILWHPETRTIVSDDQEEGQDGVRYRYIESVDEESDTFVTTKRILITQADDVYYNDPVLSPSDPDDEGEDEIIYRIEKDDCTYIIENAPSIGLAERYWPYQTPTVDGDGQGVPALAEDIAKHWLANCLQYHECGHDKDTDPILPHRVLDVVGRNENGQPFLMQTDGKQRGR